MSKPPAADWWEGASPSGAIGYVLSLAPLLLVGLVTTTYGVLELISLGRGRGRPSELSMSGASAQEWPPFRIPDGVFVVLAVVVLIICAEMWVRHRRTVAGRRPGLMAVIFFIDAEAFAVYGLEYPHDHGLVSWPHLSAGVMGLAALASLVRLLQQTVVAAARRRRAQRAFVEQLDEM